ncbi:WD repeat-containing protein 44-like isoform X1 [Salvia splendens]|uniref:WD repeat-containing protein 44-like isoform X1 n=1 Tax=Salvia splendens TaxID=180675 RepID=UPI001C25AA3F|nr:WD repeat-containing protein 44-like isoform X1 [Salvia splendens]XP_041997953.1 WD repeat-containing protein 44-like isoform X1 [Salvia splendens]XP_041997954.1 WD repeat-containing protein 44-like isoform X1 [Salvia splendens]
MDSCSDEGEESLFFDALEHIVQEPDVLSNISSSEHQEYELWTSIPLSVRDRRSKFIRWMLDPDASEGENSVDACEIGNGGDICGIGEDVEAVLGPSGVEDNSSSSVCSLSSWNADDLDMPCRVGSNDVNRTSNGGTEFRVRQNVRLGEVWAGGLDQFKSSGKFESQSPPLVQKLAKEGNCDAPTFIDRLRNRWLSRLRSMSCMMSVSVKDSQAQGKKNCRVKVQHSRKKLKELSGLFTGQDIQAHQGSILAMKFSLDGQYLASAGEDKIVRIWQVVEDDRPATVEIPDADPSCVYFSVNHLSELAPRIAEKDRFGKSIGLRQTSDSACIVFPQKGFRISEEPLHVFSGHSGEILDISWSNNNCLLSSSVDKTVRLWKVGVDHCLKVFNHTDYVTCIQFNPVNDNLFISGSIDGKVRMWSISGSKVIDWAETKDIVTAVSYRPDAKGGIIGCITGTCHLFNISDNLFQLEGQMCLAGKKKSSCKRIIDFQSFTTMQFLPQNPTKFLVTSADSHVRIVDGALNVIEKYKGLRNAGNQLSALFTPSGKHIVSACEDSNIYIWSYNGDGDSAFSQPKLVRSFECFSADASVAITWPGMKSNSHLDSSVNPLPFFSSNGFSLSQEFPIDSKGSATWPEEKLPTPSPLPIRYSMSKSEYKLFRTSFQSLSTSHAWGMVIVTAAWDGRIRSFHNYGLPVQL